VDRVTVEEFGNQLDANVAKLTAALRNGSYEPQAIRRVYIPKPESTPTTRQTR
jgi:RNA-directed DNA polymerase